MKLLDRVTRTKPTKRKKRVPDGNGDMVFSIVALVVVFGSLLGIVVVQTFIVQNRVKLDAVNAELSVERERNQQLRLEVIELEAPKRILDTATTRLGMVRPAQRKYLPGIDPNLVAIVQPPLIGDPFGPAPLTAHLRGAPVNDTAASDNAANDAAANDTAANDTAANDTAESQP